MKNFISFSKRPLIFCILFFSVTLIFSQNTWIVNNNDNVSTDFTDLQSAIDAASTGDILYVQHSPSSYGNIELYKELTIIGRSHADVGYTTTIGDLDINGGADNSVIKGCRINSISWAGSGSTIDNVSFRKTMHIAHFCYDHMLYICFINHLFCCFR